MLELHGKSLGGLALNIEWSKTSPRFDPKESRVALKNAKDKCYSCGRSGHMSRECKEGLECYGCGRFGHIARDCAKNLKSGSGEIGRKRSPRGSPRRTSSERSYSIERNCMPVQFCPVEGSGKREELEEKEIIMEDTSRFVVTNGNILEENALLRCRVCEKTMLRSSIKRHILTKMHKDKLDCN